MKKRLQARGNLLRWNRENNLYRPRLRHQLYRSNNESGRMYPPFLWLLMTIARTRILRHDDGPREDDGAIEWGKLFTMFYREDPELKKWTKQTWLKQ